MSEITIKLPDVGEGIAEAELVEWHVKVGDVVREDDILAAVMTDKAAVADVPAMTEQIDRLFESYVMQSQRDEHIRYSGNRAPAAAAAGDGPAVELF